MNDDIRREIAALRLHVRWLTVAVILLALSLFVSSIGAVFGLAVKLFLAWLLGYQLLWKGWLGKYFYRGAATRLRTRHY